MSPLQRHRAPRAGVLILLFGVTAFTTAGTARQAAPARVIWRGINTDITMGPTCQSQLVQTFEFVGEEVPDHDPRWLSRKVTWNYGESCKADVLVLENTGGATPRRVLRPWSGSCVNKGEADLNLVPDPARRGQCQESPNLGNMSNHHYPTLGWTGPRPPEDMRNGCSFNGRSRSVGSDGTVRLITYSVSVSRRQPAAVVDVDRDTYGRFVPEPGNTFTVTARSASGPVRFRFELDPAATSRFPGYATNANVDGEFFTTYNLTRLRDQYTNDGPDFVFYPSNFAETEWARIEPAVIESAAPQTSVAVTVTAMDYGAIGSLRAFVQSDDCEGAGGWQPVPVRVGSDTRESLSLPLDADDNLIADALEPYRGMQSFTDADAEPKGNGMAGDGLTAFEEYRGSLTTATACPEASIRHVRTSPLKKDLFIHTLDPQYAQVLTLFAWATGLEVHGICESHYVNNETRVVNFTLQHANLRRWGPHVISQDVPQHGVWLINREHGEGWPEGITCSEPTCMDDTVIGPPAKTYKVSVDKTRFRSDAVGARARSLVRIVVHELGHAVGIPHHGDTVKDWQIRGVHRNIDGPLIVAAGAGCQDPAAGGDSRIRGFYLDETFVGCYLSCRLVLQHAQNSGDMSCPMRYAYGTYHEAPGSNTRWVDGIRANRDSLGNSGQPTTVRFFAGRFFLYDNTLDFPPTGRFCQTTTGTGLNEAARGDDNYAGDTGLACVGHIVINDGVLPRAGRQ